MSGLIAIGILLAYALIGGMVGRFAWARYRRQKGCWPPPKCDSHYGHDFIDHGGVVGLGAGIVWPLMIPILCGSHMSDRLTMRDERLVQKENRRTAEHERKIAEMNAARKLADAEKEKTLADIKFLVENGIKADVPGLYDA